MGMQYSAITQEQARRRRDGFSLGHRKLAMSHLTDVKGLALPKKNDGDGFLAFPLKKLVSSSYQ